MKASKCCVLFLLLLCPPASPQEKRDFGNGNGFYEHCTESQSTQIGQLDSVLCAGYVAGYVRAMAYYKQVVLPRGITISQERDVVIGWLSSNPEKRNQPIDVIISTAISNAFPASK
jgi:hypothetical protein